MIINGWNLYTNVRKAHLPGLVKNDKYGWKPYSYLLT